MTANPCVRISVALCLLACVACGSSSSSSPAAPATSTPATPTPSVSTTPSVTTSGLFTFNFAAGMLLSDQDLIKSAVQSGATFYQTSMGWTITQPTTITASATDAGCVNPGASAFTGPRAVTICFANNGWSV